MPPVIRSIDSSTWDRYADEILRLQLEAYEPARQGSREFFAKILSHPNRIALVALDGDELVGYCFGAPLECFPQIDGTRTDPEWNRLTTFYSADVTVASPQRAQGIGLALKREQLRLAHELGYRYVAGRNRVGLAAAMWQLNRSFGACEIQRLENAYEDTLEPRDCVYYHIDLRTAVDGQAPIVTTDARPSEAPLTISRPESQQVAPARSTNA